MAPVMFWADHVTIHQSTDYSPFFIAHGVEAVLPLDIAEATYLLPPREVPMSTESLIACHAQQLLKCLEDLRDMADQVLMAQKVLAAQFVTKFASTINDHDFVKGSLVLICNSQVKKELNQKTRARYLGPMVVVHRMARGAYILAELDGAISRLRYTAFRVVPYFPCSLDNLPVDSILSTANLEDIALHSEDYPPADGLDVSGTIP